MINYTTIIRSYGSRSFRPFENRHKDRSEFIGFLSKRFHLGYRDNFPVNKQFEPVCRLFAGRRRKEELRSMDHDPFDRLRIVTKIAVSSSVSFRSGSILDTVTIFPSTNSSSQYAVSLND